MKATTFLRLALMMFLEYLVWGAWYVTMGTYLGQTLKVSGTEIGLAYSALSIAAMISPFFIGLIADRFFAAERVLGVLHLLGAVLMYFVSQAQDFSTFYPLMIGYTLCYMPTVALANSVSFHQLEADNKWFPYLRVFGTIAWITIGVIIGSLQVEASATQFLISAGLALVMGVYSFTLPHTPPKQKGKKVTAREIIGLDALSMFGNTSFLIFFIASILICIPLTFYYNFTNLFLNESGMVNAAGKMTFGQVSEILFLLLMPFAYKRLGVKWIMIVAMVAWVLRYVFFAHGDMQANVWMLYAGIILHGVCFDFFFVTGQIYADNEAPSHLKSSAQGLMTFATYGLGMFIGSLVSGWIVDRYTTNNVYDWPSIWYVPALLAAGVLLLFFVVFRGRKEAEM